MSVRTTIKLKNGEGGLSCNYCEITFRGKELPLRMLNEHLTQVLDKNKYKYKGLNRYDKESVSTIVLLLKTFKLYEHLYPDSAELLAFAVKHSKDGLLNGLPYVNSIDPKFEIVGEILGYIEEIRSDYYTGSHKPYHLESFADFFLNKKDKNHELFELFNHTVEPSTILHTMMEDENYILERQLDDYEKYRDNLFYRMQNVNFYLESYLNDPFLITAIQNDLYKSTILKDGVGEIKLLSSQVLTEFGMYMSYKIDGLEVEIRYVNPDNKLKRYLFKDGEMISSGYSNKELYYELIQRSEIKKINEINQYINLVNDNIDNIKIDSYIYSDKPFYFIYDVDDYNYLPIKYINTKELIDLLNRYNKDKKVYWNKEENGIKYRQRIGKDFIYAIYFSLKRNLERKLSTTQISTILYITTLLMSTLLNNKINVNVDIITKKVKGKKIFKNKGEDGNIIKRKKIFKNK